MAEIPASIPPGEAMYALARELFPICRSLTGDGVRKTLRLLQVRLPELRQVEVPSGTRCLDWEIPPEWNIRDAYLLDEAGRRVVDFRQNNLHVVGYSTPVDAQLPLEELQEHLFSLPELPSAIPYVTSYYKPFWGFCLSQQQRDALTPQTYRAVIDSTLAPGQLTYGELLLPGKSEREVLLATNICHPSMGNNETSGPVLAAFLADWIRQVPRNLSYRILFLPETIGAVAYLSRHLAELKERVIAGFQICCVGDDRAFSYLASRRGDTLADRVALNILTHHVPAFRRFSFLERGSDERQYCSPGVDLPVASVMRSKYGEYPEYHTSLDDLRLISPSGFAGSWSVYTRMLAVLEENRIYRATTLGEPQLGRRGLYPALSTRESYQKVIGMVNLLSYADGTRDLLALADLFDVSAEGLLPLARRLVDAGLLSAG